MMTWSIPKVILKMQKKSMGVGMCEEAREGFLDTEHCSPLWFNQSVSHLEIIYYLS
jgi:hypothetical protein